MEIFQARKRAKSGRYDYTCTYSGGTYPLGYCAGNPDDSRPKYHNDGHATPEEAAACYRGYLLDHHLTFTKEPRPDAQYPCEVCRAWTQHGATLDDGGYPRVFNLCLAHQTREDVARLLKPTS